MNHVMVRSLAGAIAIGLSIGTALALQGVKTDVPYVPTPAAVVDRMLELTAPKPGEVLMDLGSGDGRIAIAAAKRYDVTAIGIDIDPVRIKEAQANARTAGVEDKVEFRRQDLFEADIGKADVITLYLLESVNVKLRPRLLEELRPGTRIVSHAFTMGDWRPERHERVEQRNVYFWTVPARVEGRWRADNGVEFELKQTYQDVSGSARIEGRTVPIEDGRLDGAELTFTVDGQPYRATVEGGTIRAAGGNGDAWRAVRS